MILIFIALLLVYCLSKDDKVKRFAKIGMIVDFVLILVILVFCMSWLSYIFTLI